MPPSFFKPTIPTNYYTDTAAIPESIASLTASETEVNKPSTEREPELIQQIREVFEASAPGQSARRKISAS